MAVEMARIVSQLSAFLTASAVFSDELDRLEAPEDLAFALCRYSQNSVDTMRIAWRDISLDTTRIDAWEVDIHRLRAEPTDERVWAHIVLAMNAVASLHEQLYTYTGVQPEDVASHREAHAENTSVFQESSNKAAAGKAPSADLLRRVMRWMVTRGAELARRNVMLVLAAKAPDQVANFLPYLTPREGRP